MRLTTAWVLVLAAASGAHGFQLSASSSSPRLASSKMQVSMVATEVEAESSPSTSPNGTMTYADVNKLAYRALQKECKALGLLAVGTTAALRKNLLEHFGLARESAAVEVPSATAAEIEVRTRYYGHCNNPIVFCEGCIFFCAPYYMTVLSHIPL